MRYQLVLQFAPWRDRSFDSLIALEERLEAIADLDTEVDGHDLGSGEANIFLFTDDPTGALTRCLPSVGAEGLTSLLSAAYRPIGQDAYVRTWPLGDPTPFEVR